MDVLDEAKAEKGAILDKEEIIIEKMSEKEGELLLRLYEVYANIQVEADTIYHNRTSVITLTQGLLFVAFDATGGASKSQFISAIIAAIGLILGILWIFFEQRNLIYFKGRASVLIDIESKLLSDRSLFKDSFVPFWSNVRAWVKNNAVIYQRASAQQILRFYVPLLFVLAWLAIFIFTIMSFKRAPANPPSVFKFVKSDVSSVSIKYDCNRI